VFYIPDEEEWQEACFRAQKAGFEGVASHNPYWDKEGRTYEDPDGYRIVFHRSVWSKD